MRRETRIAPDIDEAIRRLANHEPLTDLLSEQGRAAERRAVRAAAQRQSSSRAEQQSSDSSRAATIGQ